MSRATYVAVRLGSPDLIAPRSARELSAGTATFAPALLRLLRSLAAFGVFREVGPGQDAAARLKACHPESLQPMLLFLGSENYWETWGMLGECVRTGTTSNDR